MLLIDNFINCYQAWDLINKLTVGQFCKQESHLFLVRLEVLYTHSDNYNQL